MKKKLFPRILSIRVTDKQKKFVEVQAKDLGENTYIRGLIQQAMNKKKDGC